MHNAVLFEGRWRRIHDDRFNVVDEFEMFVPGQQGPSSFHFRKCNFPWQADSMAPITLENSYFSRKS
jgi:hypothetical protein